MSAWLLVAAANAADCPLPFTEPEVRAVANASEAAVFKDDALTHKRLFTEFVARVPCLDHQLSKDAFAELLLDEAIVRYVAKVEWHGLLDTALRISPDLERVPDYLRTQWVRTAPPEGQAPVPEDATLFVDGVLAPELPGITGEHVVQVWRDGRWRSVYVDGLTGVPTDWLVPKAKEVLEVVRGRDSVQAEPRATVGVQFGVLVANQLVEDPGTYLADASHVGGASAIAARGVLPVAGAGGVFAEGRLRLIVPSVRSVAGNPTFEPSAVVLPGGYTGPALVFERVHFGMGVGGFALQKLEGDVPTTLYFPQGHATVGGRGQRSVFDLGAGLSPSGGHAGVSGGWILNTAPVGVLVGFDGGLEGAWFKEAPPGNRRASVLQVSVLARIDATFGMGQ